MRITFLQTIFATFILSWKYTVELISVQSEIAMFRQKPKQSPQTKMNPRTNQESKILSRPSPGMHFFLSKNKQWHHSGAILLDYNLSFYYICVWNYSLVCISYWQCLKPISFLNFECSDWAKIKIVLSRLKNHKHGMKTQTPELCLSSSWSLLLHMMLKLLAPVGLCLEPLVVWMKPMPFCRIIAKSDPAPLHIPVSSF